MSKAVYDHNPHSYKALNSNKRVYKCTISGCTHSINAAMLLGRKAKCPECETILVVTEEHLRRINITCVGCGRSGFAKGLSTTTQPPQNVQAAAILEKFTKAPRDT